MKPPHVLVVDDDPHARDLLRRLLSPMGRVSASSDAAGAEQLLASGEPVDLVLTDMAMPDVSDALEVLPATREPSPHTSAIVLPACGNTAAALAPIQRQESYSLPYTP